MSVPDNDSQNDRNEIGSLDAGVISGKTSSHSQLITESSPIVRKGAAGSHTTTCEQRTQEIHVVKMWMLQGMPIFKAKFQTGYAQIPNETLQDARLSFEARGLLSLMLSLPEDWGFNNEWLMKQSQNCKKVKLTRMLRELSDCGYLVQKAKRSKDNRRLDGWDYFVFPIDTKKHPEALPLAGSSESAKTSPAGNQPGWKPATTNKHINKQTKTTTTSEARAKISEPDFVNLVVDTMKTSGIPEYFISVMASEIWEQYSTPRTAMAIKIIHNDWTASERKVAELHTQQEHGQPALDHKSG